MENQSETSLLSSKDDGQHCHLTYVLITPARDEAAFIEKTIKSVVAQTLRPVKWVIVSDGSTDGTDDIVLRYVTEHKWIELVRMPERKERHFAGKVLAFNAGYERVRHLNYDVIGNLDADISFEQDYISFLLSKFSENPRLGVDGTPFKEGSHQYNYRFVSIEHVSGACQLFRRECFKEIGGYKPNKLGGVDLVAVLTARMKGWQTRTFLEKTCIHHRKMGKEEYVGLMAFYRIGRGDYILGVHPVWEFLRSIYHMKNRPFVLGSCLRLAGFYWAELTRLEKSMPNDLVDFRRKEQMNRLRGFFRKMLVPGRLTHAEGRTSAGPTDANH
jgi:poly-beta-1,6-N-acetyl-D-glucosamine synthase